MERKHINKITNVSDWVILREADSRKNLYEISRSGGVSHPNCWRAQQWLESNGYISKRELNGKFIINLTYKGEDAREALIDMMRTV